MVSLYIPEDVDVYWSVYRRIGRWSGDWWVIGSQAILFNNKSLNLLEKNKDLYKFTHMDFYLTKFLKFMENKENVKWKTAEKKIGYEYDHTSLISNKKNWNRYTKPN